MSPRIVILTGAGISAQSGVPTFRDADGLWENHRVEDVASPDGFRRDPTLVQRFYDLRRRDAQTVEPNAAHLALARLERALGDDVLVVTQNIDDLHEQAGSTNVLHMHGDLLSALCTTCGARHHWKDDLSDNPRCPSCGKAALRPDVVWFGEIPYYMDQITAAVESCELFVVIGTSGVVYPAAGLAWAARASGAETALLNLEDQDSSEYDVVHLGPATQVVPAWVDEVLAGGTKTADA